jgi:hypothetical protein
MVQKFGKSNQGIMEKWIYSLRRKKKKEKIMTQEVLDNKELIEAFVEVAEKVIDSESYHER